MNKKYGYARVSTKEQNLDRQIEALKGHGIAEKDIRTDKASGKDFNREGYKALKEQLLRSGDILVIKELDRLGRDMEQIKQEWQELLEMGIDIVVLDTPILNTTNKNDIEKNLISNIVFELLTYMAEKERLKIRARQREGIDQAKAQGKHLGRPRADIPEGFEVVYSDWKQGNITGVKAMEQLRLKRTTFYKIVKEYEENKITE